MYYSVDKTLDEHYIKHKLTQNVLYKEKSRDAEQTFSLDKYINI